MLNSFSLAYIILNLFELILLNNNKSHKFKKDINNELN